jgi:hypothetical protein
MGCVAEGSRMKSAQPPAALTYWVYEKESNSLIFNEYSLSTVIAGLIKEETSQHNSRALFLQVTFHTSVARGHADYFFAFCIISSTS